MSFANQMPPRLMVSRTAGGPRRRRRRGDADKVSSSFHDKMAYSAMIKGGLMFGQKRGWNAKEVGRQNS